MTSLTPQAHGGTLNTYKDEDELSVLEGQAIHYWRTLEEELLVEDSFFSPFLIRRN